MKGIIIVLWAIAVLILGYIISSSVYSIIVFGVIANYGAWVMYKENNRLEK